MSKLGEAGAQGTPKIQVTSSLTTGMPQNPHEGDEFHDTSTNIWYVYKNGSWQYVELP